MDRKRYLNGTGREWIDKYRSKTKYIQDFYSGYASIINIDSVRKRLAFPAECGELCLCDNGYTWLTFLPDKSNWCMSAMYDDKGNIIEWYFDITKENGIDKLGNPYQNDLYLDVVLMPNGEIVKFDEDELQDALNNGAITKQEFDMAYEVCDRLINDFLSVENKVNSFCERCFSLLAVNS